MGGRTLQDQQKDDRYAGREHSRIKHLFLTEYLKAAAFKTFQGRSPIFNYIDGFAGPWSVSDEEDYSDTSFAQSIKTLLAVKEALETTRRERFTVRFYLCEKNPLRVERLRQYADRQQSLNIRVFEGPFETRLDDIAKECARGFSFTFIDPTGFNLGSLEIAQFLARMDGEFLLNFMSEHINRYPSVESVRATFGRLLADTDWKVRFDALPSHLKNEQRILIILKERMKELGAARYMPDFEILNPRAKRLQMRLVLGTNHPAGVEAFREVQVKIEPTQHEIREGIRHPGQASMFNLAVNDGVGSRAACGDARRIITNMLADQPSVRFDDLIGPVMENAAVRLTHLKDILGDMRKAGEVAFELAGRQKKPNLGTVIRRGGEADVGAEADARRNRK
jgi:hypothetical protein